MGKEIRFISWHVFIIYKTFFKIPPAKITVFVSYL